MKHSRVSFSSLADERVLSTSYWWREAKSSDWLRMCLIVTELRDHSVHIERFNRSQHLAVMVSIENDTCIVLVHAHAAIVRPLFATLLDPIVIHTVDIVRYFQNNNYIERFEAKNRVYSNCEPIKELSPSRSGDCSICRHCSWRLWTTLFEACEPLGHIRRLPFLRVERRWRDEETKTDQWRYEGGEVGGGEKVSKTTALKVLATECE